MMMMMMMMMTIRSNSNVQGQISEHIFKVKWRLLCLLFFNMFRNTQDRLKIGDIPQFKLGHIQSRNAFKSIACEQNYLMDYNGW